MQKNNGGIYLSILLVGFGLGILLYHFLSTSSTSFSKEYQQSKIHTRKIDSLLIQSNRKIDSMLVEIDKLKDSIGILESQQKISNTTVYEYNSKLHLTNKLTNQRLQSSKSKLLMKESKIDSLEIELSNLKPKMQ
jgi:hypothetical protein